MRGNYAEIPVNEGEEGENERSFWGKLGISYVCVCEYVCVCVHSGLTS